MTYINWLENLHNNNVLSFFPKDHVALSIQLLDTINCACHNNSNV